MKKKYLYLYSISLVLFLSLILMLCWYFRLSTDDYYYLSEIENKGIQHIITYSYFKWSGRFAACAVMNSLLSLLQAHERYFFLIPLGTFILLISGVHVLINRLAVLYSIKINLLFRLVLTVSFVALLFFMSFDIGETWFWCSSTGCYVFNILALIWGLYFLLCPKSTVLTLSGIIICFVFIGGSAEVYAFFFWLLSAGFIFYRYKNTVDEFFQNPFHKKLVLACVALTISFIILILAPGNYLRNQLLPPHRFFFSFFIAGKSIIKFFIFYLPVRMHYLLLFSIPFFFAGSAFRESNEKKFRPDFTSFFKRLTLFFIVFLGLFSYLTAYLMSETGPARLWFLVTFLFSVYCCLLSFYGGYSIPVTEKAGEIIQAAGSSAVLIILSYCIFHQFHLVSRYSASFDNREKALKEFHPEANMNAVLVISSLPPSGMLYPAEITADTTHYKNQHLRQGYKLRFHVVEN